MTTSAANPDTAFPGIRPFGNGVPDEPEGDRRPELHSPRAMAPHTLSTFPSGVPIYTPAPDDNELADAAVAELLRRPGGTYFDELARITMSSAERAHPGLSRREIILKMGMALSLTAASPILGANVADITECVEQGLRHPNRLDQTTLDHIEEILLLCRQQGDVLGPQIALQTALAQQQAVRTILPGVPGSLRTRSLALYAEITQCVGWLLFNLGDYRRAQHCYEDARAVAHDAENVDLVTYILCTMSHLATWEGKPRVGIDHAVAANAWAQQTDSPYAQSYAADVAARAYAADHQHGRCLAALDQEQVAVASLGNNDPASSWWYFYDESFYLGTKSECLLRLGRTEDAAQSAKHALGRGDPTNVHNYVLTMSLQGEAHVQQGNTREAAEVIGDMAQLATASCSTRIVQRIGDLRGALGRWNKSIEVKELDQRLTLYGLDSSLRGRTNRS